MGKHIKLRLIVMNILQWAIWGAYLTSMGNYLVQVGLGPKIGLFYAMQGIVSIFMPALMGIVADKWLGATKTLALCLGFGLCRRESVAACSAETLCSTMSPVPLQRE